jgi:hypothetical protein
VSLVQVRSGQDMLVLVMIGKVKLSNVKPV